MRSLTAKSCGVRPGHRPPAPPPRDNPRASGALVAPLRGRLTARHGPLEPGMEVRFLPPERLNSAWPQGTGHDGLQLSSSMQGHILEAWHLSCMRYEAAS